VPMPVDRAIDGIDLMPFVAGKQAGLPHQILFWRSGGYKVVRDRAWTLQVLGLQHQSLLYDLKTDPTEQYDVAASQPAMVAQLTALLARHDAESVKPAWPSLIQSPIAIDRPLGTKPRPKEPFIYWWN